jgi:hypothetical protein
LHAEKPAGFSTFGGRRAVGAVSPLFCGKSAGYGDFSRRMSGKNQIET